MNLNTEKFSKPANRSVLEGNVKDVIIQFVQKKSINLIVIGNRGLGEFSKILLGGISNKLVNQSPSSILVVK